jgi:hypothetical protein
LPELKPLLKAGADYRFSSTNYDTSNFAVTLAESKNDFPGGVRMLLRVVGERRS